MDEYTLMALRAVANHSGKAGDVLAIQGIRDMVEEYLGVHREIFSRELVKNLAILDGAFLMCQKRRERLNERYMKNQATYEDVYDTDLQFMEMYDLYPITRSQSIPCCHHDTHWEAEEAARLAEMEAEWRFEAECDMAMSSYYNR
jgi:hypothetical protein